jgi:hypothetical protein
MVWQAYCAAELSLKLKEKYVEFNSRALPAETTLIDERSRKQIKALGYLP